MKNNQSSLLFLLATVLFTFLFSCSKEAPAVIAEEVASIDSTLVNNNPASSDTLTISCDPTEYSYSSFIVPLVTAKCLQCHSGEGAFGGVYLDSYEGVKVVADNGRLYGAVSWQFGFELMPQGEPQLPECFVSNVKAWVDDGAPNN